MMQSHDGASRTSGPRGRTASATAADGGVFDRGAGSSNTSTGNGSNGDGGGDGYGWSPEIQRKTLASCLRDPDAWRDGGKQVYDAQWVTHMPLRPVAEVLYDACAKNNGPPSPELLEQLVEERLPYLRPTVAEAVRTECRLVLSADVSDAPLLRMRAAEFARVQAVARAVMKGAELVDRGASALANGNGTALVRMMQDALAVGSQQTSGVIRMVGDPATVARLIEVDPPRIATGIAALDRALHGGATAGLHVVAGDSKLGKTSFLAQIARGGAAVGKTTYWASAEMGERPMAMRFLAGMSGRTQAEVRENPRHALRSTRSYRLAGGEILLEYAPSFTAGWFATRVRQLEAEGLRIHQCIADYIDIMGHDKHFGEERFRQKEICHELRDFAVEAGIPVWSAKAVGRQAINKTIVTKRDLAEANFLSYLLDNLFALCSTEQERRKGGVLRVGGRDWQTPIVRLFYATGRLDIDEWTIAGYQRDNDRQRWREIPQYVEWFAEQARRQQQSQAGA